MLPRTNSSYFKVRRRAAMFWAFIVGGATPVWHTMMAVTVLLWWAAVIMFSPIIILWFFALFSWDKELDNHD